MSKAASKCGHITRSEVAEMVRVRKGNRRLEDCAREWGVDFREISKVMRGGMYPSDRLLRVLGLERCGEMYRKRTIR